MDEHISKSQKKRDALDLQDIGRELIGLTSQNLDKLPLTESLRKAIDEAKLIKSHGALRRQSLYIGKLIRASDFEAIKEAFAAFKEEASSQSAHFHELEIWRDRLIHEGKEALTAVVAAYPGIDIQKLRHLTKKASTAIDNPAPARALFRFLRENL